MRIGINAIAYSPGSLGGVETYLRSLWEHLQPIDSENSYELYCQERYQNIFPVTSPNFGYRAFNYGYGSFNWLVRGILSRTIGFDILRKEINKIEVDLIHHPFTVLTPLGTKIPSVLTFADMQHEFYPDFFPKKLLKKRNKQYRASVHEATRVIVNSEFTKKNLIEIYETDENKIDVIYHGYDSSYNVKPSECLEKIREKYNLKTPFLYYPAASWPHKNHKNLLHALKLLCEKHRFDGQLVLTGIATQLQSEILALIANLGLANHVKILGYLPYEDLPYLYNLAEIMVFPTFFEGFGLPLVEAMACGCPVVCSNVTSIPEVVGESGVMFNPHSIEEIAETVWSVWTDPAKQLQMMQAGLNRSAQFNWLDTAQQTKAVYKKALS